MKTKSILRVIAGFPLAATNSANYTMSSTAAAGRQGLGAATTDHRRAGARLQV